MAGRRVSEEHFTVAYDGLALEAHRMRVSDLAPALLAMSDAIRAAQAVLAPNEPPFTLDIKAARVRGPLARHAATAAVQTMDGLRSEYTVRRVLEHVPGGRQLPLDFGDEPA